MKIVFEEKDINMALMMMNQLKVEGIQQATMLVSINNILNSGKQLEDKAEKKGE
ncbi:hypothetical protein [Lacrimispora sp. 210928-DFI.3.58]|uniref:hypothetical protein n=1 Tax=Lacrimispora sp. 210928-DFI.3.58 TaxID=2883214 RepID=UPI0015B4CBC6|nr:hypothetical protein [Lacrimispora sp. 210928-DFI.3.58]MCB7317518.1 hypothetical protein [Lacrimispora sp. 210928-DFI.3.58]